MTSKSIDIGSIHIHKKVIADIIYSIVKEVQGVRLVSDNLWDKLLSLLGRENFPGVKIKADNRQSVSLTVKIIIGRGINIPDIARQLQDSIKEAIESTVNVNIKVINVNIQGVERGIR